MGELWDERNADKENLTPNDVPPKMRLGEHGRVRD